MRESTTPQKMNQRDFDTNNDLSKNIYNSIPKKNIDILAIKSKKNQEESNLIKLKQINIE